MQLRSCVNIVASCVDAAAKLCKYSCQLCTQLRSCVYWYLVLLWSFVEALFPNYSCLDYGVSAWHVPCLLPGHPRNIVCSWGVVDICRDVVDICWGVVGICWDVVDICWGVVGICWGVGDNYSCLIRVFLPGHVPCLSPGHSRNTCPRLDKIAPQFCFRPGGARSFFHVERGLLSWWRCHCSWRVGGMLGCRMSDVVCCCNIVLWGIAAVSSLAGWCFLRAGVVAVVISSWDALQLCHCSRGRCFCARMWLPC